MSLTQKIFHVICVNHYHKLDYSYGDNFEKGLNGAEEFFSLRFKGKIDFTGKTVLDIGCGLGSACIYMAQNGAKKVVGVDIIKSDIDFAKLKLNVDYQNLSNKVEFLYAKDLGDEKFDIVLSKDSFEHYADPEKFIFTMKKYLREKGIMAIGFSPLWKSPYGGHISFMTKIPWAHLLFPETVIMAERKRFRPDEQAHSFNQVIGGLNKMTLSRYFSIIREANLKIIHFNTNISSNKLIKLFNILKVLPFCREYFTVSVYTILTEN